MFGLYVVMSVVLCFYVLAVFGNACVVMFCVCVVMFEC